MVLTCVLPLLALLLASTPTGLAAAAAAPTPVLPRGVDPAQQAQYSGATFTCADGSKTIPIERVNDDYCDCFLDGSDEPGACGQGGCGGGAEMAGRLCACTRTRACMHARNRFPPSLRKQAGRHPLWCAVTDTTHAPTLTHTHTHTPRTRRHQRLLLWPLLVQEPGV